MDAPVRNANVAQLASLLESMATQHMSLMKEVASLLRAEVKRTRRRRRFWHSPDFRSIIWNHQPENFTAKQAKVIAHLWRASVNGAPDISAEWLIENVLDEAADEEPRGRRDRETSRLAALFAGNEAWGRSVGPGATKGAYRMLGEGPERVGR